MQTAVVTSPTSPTSPTVFRQNPALGFLDAFAAELAMRPDVRLVDKLIARVDDARRSMTETQWRILAGEMLTHPICDLLLEDPYTRRAYEKPRGYAGDAVMLDMLYGQTTKSLSPVGAAVFRATTQALSGDAVRERRVRMGSAMDALARLIDRPAVVSVACGHARELERSAAFAAGAVEVTCFDQDADSLAVVARDYPSALRVQGSVKHLLSGRAVLPSADLVTCAGLFDYLADDVASALLTRFIDAAKPGGRILVANFASDSTDRGYMEAFMNWWLIYRSESELLGLVKNHGLQSVHTYRDQSGRVIYLDIVR